MRDKMLLVTHPIVVLRAGDPIPEVAEVRGFYPAWISAAAGDAWPHEWSEHDVRTDAPLPSLNSASAFIITGSSDSVTERLPWMLRLEGFIRDVVGHTPLFGICFGHQLVAQALGGTVEKNPKGREIGTIKVTRFDEDPMFKNLPANFDANATHVDTVIALPSNARLLACSPRDRHQAFAVGSRTRCVQFHPEFDGDAIRRYLTIRAPLITAEGDDPSSLLANAKDAPYGVECLRNFIREIVAK